MLRPIKLTPTMETWVEALGRTYNRIATDEIINQFYYWERETAKWEKDKNVITPNPKALENARDQYIAQHLKWEVLDVTSN